MPTIPAEVRAKMDAAAETSQSPAISTVAKAVILKRTIDLRARQEKAMKAELTGLLDQIPNLLDAESLDSVKWDGTTVSPKRTILSSKREDVEMETLCDAIIEAGSPEFVKRSVHAQTLGAFVREVDDTLQEAGFEGDWDEAMKASLGEQLFDCLNLFEQNRAGFTNITKKEK